MVTNGKELKAGRYIDLAKPYCEADAIIVSVNEGGEYRYMHVCGGKHTYWKGSPAELMAGRKLVRGPTFAYGSDIGLNRLESCIYADFLKNITEFIAHSASASLQELILFLRQPELNYKQDYIESALRWLIAIGGLKLIPGKSLSDTKIVQKEFHKNIANEQKFAESLAADLKIQSDRIGYLIKHKPSLGTYREELFKQLLRRYVPKRYAVAGGFVVGCARQLDIIVYDCLDFSPLMQEGSFVVVPPEAVRAVIEIKSELKTSSIKEALEAFFELNEVLRIASASNEFPVFTGIFGFEGVTAETAKDTLIEEYSQIIAELSPPGVPKTECVLDLEFLTRLCIHESILLGVEYYLDDDYKEIPYVVEFKSILSRNVATVGFIAALLSYLRLSSMNKAEEFRINDLIPMAGVPLI